MQAKARLPPHNIPTSGPGEAPQSSWRASGLRPPCRLSRELKGGGFWPVKQKEKKQQQQQQLLKDSKPQGQKLNVFLVSPLDGADFRSDGIIEPTCWPKKFNSKKN